MNTAMPNHESQASYEALLFIRMPTNWPSVLDLRKELGPRWLFSVKLLYCIYGYVELTIWVLRLNSSSRTSSSLASVEVDSVDLSLCVVRRDHTTILTLGTVFSILSRG